MKPSCNVATLIERYFTERLMRQRNVSISHPTGTRSGCCSRLHRRGFASSHRPLRSTISMRLSSARSSRISKRSEAPASGRATCA
jgi:hypothetical protein